MADEGRRDAERRHALKLIIGAGGAAFACVLAAPAAVFGAAPARAGGTGGARWVRTVKRDALPDGEPKKVAIVSDTRDAWTVEKDVELGAVWLVRHGNEVRAWSVTCPHLGCAINVTAGATFGCPCHTSAFDADGKRTGGPSPRDMDALVTKIEGGYVLVDVRKYRMGTTERVEVG
jgi:menaquinol-cytochrome c reductase iron-sulfur subunit